MSRTIQHDRVACRSVFEIDNMGSPLKETIYNIVITGYVHGSQCMQVCGKKVVFCMEQDRLTISQTTNFRLFQTQRLCRQQFHM